MNYYKLHVMNTAKKLGLWGAQIDTSYFDENTKEEIIAFASALTQEGVLGCSISF